MVYVQEKENNNELIIEMMVLSEEEEKEVKFQPRLHMERERYWCMPVNNLL